MVRVEKYRNKNGNCPLDDFIKELLNDHLIEEIALINHNIKLLENFGCELRNMYPKLIKKLGFDIYELRIKKGNNRILYFYYDKGERKFVLLHGFKKKDEKTPKSQIEKAKNEMKDYLQKEEKIK